MRVNRRTYIRRRISVATGFGLVLLAAFYLPITLLAPLPAALATTVTSTVPTNPAIELDWPTYGSSALGAVGFPGVLDSQGPDTPRPIASISKIVTSLVVLEHKPLAPGDAGPTITMTSADTALYYSYLARNGQVRPVWSGLKLTERQVLELVLITSANNYAESLATWAFGSVSAFVDAVDIWLETRGLHDTTIKEPTGMDPRNTSTTANLIELAKIAVTDPVISAITATRTLTLPHFGTIKNSNELLGVDNVVGIKTGTLPEAGACLLFASTMEVEGNQVVIVGVVLGGPDHPTVDAAVRKLIASATLGFRQLTIVTAGDSFFSYSTPWKQQARAIATKDATVFVWAGTPISRNTTAIDVRNATPGQRVGTVTVHVGTTTQVISLDLDAPIGDPGAWWRLTHPFG